MEKLGNGDGVKSANMAWYRSREFWVFFSLLVSVYAFWLIGQWPGYYDGDTIHILLRTMADEYPTWTSYLVSYQIKFFHSITANLVSLGIFQSFATALLGSYIFWQAIRDGAARWVVYPFVLLFALLPFNAIMALSYTRVWIFFWPLTGMLVLLWRLAKWRGPFTVKAYAMILTVGLIFGFCGAIRVDGLIVAVPIVGGAFIFFKQRRAVLLLAAALLSSFWLFNKALAPSEHIAGRVDYSVLAVAQPIAYILVHGGDEITREPEIKELSFFFVIDRLKEALTDQGLHTANFGRTLDNVSSRRLFIAAAKLCVKYFSLCMADRWSVFMQLVGYERPMFYYGDSLRFPQHNGVPPQIQALAQKAPQATRAGRLQLKIARPVHFFTNVKWASVLCFSHIWQLALIIVGLLLMRRAPIAGWLCAIVLVHALGLVLTAPGSQFSYLYWVHIVGFFVVPLIAVEMRYRSFLSR